MAWYSTGTVSVSNGSKIVTGTATAWFGALQAGWGFVSPDGRAYEIATVNSATQITLKKAFTGSTASGQEYAAFPTMSLAHDLVERLNTLIAGFQSVKDEAGAGKFGDGSLGAPGVGFLLDQDTGLRRPSSNEVALTAGGVDQLSVKGGAAKGAAVQASALDATFGKLFTTGGFGVGTTAPPSLQNSGQLDAPTGLYSIEDADGWPFDGALIQLRRNAGRGLQIIARATSTSPGESSDILVRTSGASFGGWSRLLLEADAQSSATDADTSKLQKVGGFGLGAATIFRTAYNSISAADRKNSFIGTDGGRVDGPPDGGAFRPGLMLHRAASERTSIVHVTDKTLALRNYSDGSPEADWIELLSKANMVGTVSQSGGVPTGAIVQRGSNGNGEFVRFADGTQICWNTVNMSAVDATAAAGSLFATATRTWNSPASFSSAPTLSGTGHRSNEVVMSGVSFRTAPTNSAIDWFLWLTESSTHSGYRGASLMAVGRWF